MKPAQRMHLHRIVEFVENALRADHPATEIIATLVAQHRATYTCRPHTNTLRVAGVTATCTWSKDTGLLDGWRRNAKLRFAREMSFGRCD